MPESFLNACRLCGATSYRRVLARDETGVLKPNGLYQCSGCTVVFADPGAWRDGGSDGGLPTEAVKPLTPDRASQDGRKVASGHRTGSAAES